MKVQLPTLLLSLAGSALAAPLESRQTSLVTVTDNYLFSLTLPQFTTKRNAQDPASLDWTTDGCTSSPDNPLGFPFIPACHRHDFGYHNYRHQNRFTESGKLRIDDNFKKEYGPRSNIVSRSCVDRMLTWVLTQFVLSVLRRIPERSLPCSRRRLLRRRPGFRGRRCYRGQATGRRIGQGIRR